MINPDTTTHRLVNNTLTVERDGIRALCTCGWETRGRFSSLIASAAFQDHVENSTDRNDTPRAQVRSHGA